MGMIASTTDDHLIAQIPPVVVAIVGSIVPRYDRGLRRWRAQVCKNRQQERGRTTRE